jgi:hypothetical protein
MFHMTESRNADKQLKIRKEKEGDCAGEMGWRLRISELL